MDTTIDIVRRAAGSSLQTTVVRVCLDSDTPIAQTLEELTQLEAGGYISFMDIGLGGAWWVKDGRMAFLADRIRARYESFTRGKRCAEKIVDAGWDLRENYWIHPIARDGFPGFRKG